MMKREKQMMMFLWRLFSLCTLTVEYLRLLYYLAMGKRLFSICFLKNLLKSLDLL